MIKDATRAAPLLQGEFPVSPEPHLGLCARCPGRGTLCSWPEEESLRPLGEVAGAGGAGS